MANEEASSPGANTILIVECDLTLRDTYAECLQSNGFAVACAASGPAAIRLLPDLIPGIVVLDMDLPGGSSGAVVLAFIRSHPALHGTAVIAIGRQSQPTGRVHLMSADRFLPKPVSASEVLASVNSLSSATAS